MPPLIFVDTNIFLDSYRIGREITLDMLERLDPLKENIIMTDLVEMEFKKNRQQCIIDSISEMKEPSTFGHIPGFLRHAKEVTMVAERQKDVKSRVKKMRDRVESILERPSYNDPVYKIAQRLFNMRTPYNLRRPDDKRYEVRQLAHKRWQLGYPPRKDKDRSIGDAVNWEWIIQCAKDSAREIVIVSRDGDFGSELRGSVYLNDWLVHEFKERVSRQRRISLTKSLSSALKEYDQTITVGQIEEEEKELEIRPLPSHLKVVPTSAVHRIRSYAEINEELERIMSGLRASCAFLSKSDEEEDEEVD